MKPEMAMYCPICGGDANFCQCRKTAIQPKKQTQDVSCIITQAMFELLVAGKQVSIEQPDGSRWHFSLEDMGFSRMEKAVRTAKLMETGYADC